VFAANAAWLVLAVMAFNLTRAAATLTGGNLAKAVTGTVRRKLVNVAARIASSARRITLHLPSNWPWQTPWTRLFAHVCGPPATANPDHHADHRPDRRPEAEHPRSEAGRPTTSPTAQHRDQSKSPTHTSLIGGSRLRWVTVKLPLHRR
jgi:hypothetical protein